ncbi:phage protein Gp36 family protein [Embleya sp. NPDC050154]|uniref:phage protein Gp36 family protein n=1 Tax=Embleya sp. NPDC050154 TaxID=3363988 RepID=UPI00378FD7EB
MAYSTVEDVREALSRDGIEDRTTGAGLSDEQIQDQIVEADATIDVYVGGRYVTPVVLTAPQVEPMRSWSRAIAAYLSAGIVRKNRNIPTAGYVQRYEATMEQLRTIRDGKGRISGAPIAPLEPPPGDTDGDGLATVTVINQYCGTLLTPADAGLSYGYGCEYDDAW